MPDPSSPSLTTGGSRSVAAPAAAQRGEHVPDTGELTLVAMSHELPEFATVMRGYDRGQVEDYVQRLQEFLHDAEQRATHADRRLAQTRRKVEDLERELARAAELAVSPGAAYDGLGERISTILRLAAEEAASVRDAARNEAETIVEEARRETDRARMAAEQSLSDLARRRDEVVAELNRVRDILTTLGVSAQDQLQGEPAEVAQERPGAPADPTVVIDLNHRQAARST